MKGIVRHCPVSLPLFTLFSLCLVFWGCAGIAERGGRMLDGSDSEEKVLAEYRSDGGQVLRRIRYRNGKEGMTLCLDEWPGLKLYLDYEGSTGNNGEQELSAVSCYFLCPNLSGWNEWTMELSGTGMLRKEENSYMLALKRIETIDLSWGRIRNNEIRISGDQALAALKNRKERIAVLSEWMKNPESLTVIPPVFAAQKEFEDWWKPVLLPEITRKKKRPVWYTEKAAEWVKAEDIRWNKTYTGEYFGEELAFLRDSGALLRDWEEALPWIYLLYQWDGIIQLITEETILR